jgi:hypothetical protein
MGFERLLSDKYLYISIEFQTPPLIQEANLQYELFSLGREYNFISYFIDMLKANKDEASVW